MFLENTFIKYFFKKHRIRKFSIFQNVFKILLNIGFVVLTFFMLTNSGLENKKFCYAKLGYVPITLVLKINYAINGSNLVFQFICVLI